MKARLLKSTYVPMSIEHAYVHTDKNLLCLRNHALHDEEYRLTTDTFSGIHQDKQVVNQEIYYQDQFASPNLHDLNFHYIEMNQCLTGLNVARCCIYMPLEWKPDRNWYKDDLEFEEIIKKDNL